MRRDANLKKLIVWVIAVGVIVVGVAIATQGGTSSSGNDVGGGDDFGIAVQDPELVAEGDPLYRTECGWCHGYDLRGTGAGPSLLSVVYEPGRHPDETFVLAARNGVVAHHWDFGDMDPVPGLSDDDMDRIIAFVRENQRIEGFEPYPPE